MKTQCECGNVNVKWEVSYSEVVEDRIPCCTTCFTRYHQGEELLTDVVFLGSPDELMDETIDNM